MQHTVRVGRFIHTVLEDLGPGHAVGNPNGSPPKAPLFPWGTSRSIPWRSAWDKHCDTKWWSPRGSRNCLSCARFHLLWWWWWRHGQLSEKPNLRETPRIPFGRNCHKSWMNCHRGVSECKANPAARCRNMLIWSNLVGGFNVYVYIYITITINAYYTYIYTYIYILLYIIPNGFKDVHPLFFLLNIFETIWDDLKWVV